MPATRFHLHHLGVAVTDLDSALRFYREALGCELLSGPFHDPLQRVAVCFIGSAGAGQIELVAPIGEDSPVHRYLTREVGAYHTCYEVDSIEQAVEGLREQGCLVLSKPVPAVAFAGRRIVWLYTPTRHLLELLEQDPPK